MSGFVTVGAYNATVRIPSFLGLNQYGDGVNFDPRYAVDCNDMCTDGGMLCPCAAEDYLRNVPELVLPEEPDVSHQTSTLMLFSLTHAHDAPDDARTVLVAAMCGRLWYCFPNATTPVWSQIYHPNGGVQHEEGWDGPTEYASDVWSYLQYEYTPNTSGAATRDVLLLSNPVDGMVALDGALWGDVGQATFVTTPKKFAVIARYNERVWGTGIESDPDMLCYSAPYDPFDWTENTEIPEDGAGDILQPSWDGDRFIALKQFGGQLIAFKETRAWRIMGTDPGEFVFKEQLGGGTKHWRTVAELNDRLLVLGDDGVYQYDGASVTPFEHPLTEDVFKQTLDFSHAVACAYKGKYYVSFTRGGEYSAQDPGAGVENNTLLIFDSYANTWLKREYELFSMRTVANFLPTPDALLFTSQIAPNRVYVYKNNGWESGRTYGYGKWVTPWMDLGLKDAVKSAFEVYVTVEGKAGLTDAMPIPRMFFTIETEKRAKEREYLPPVTEDGGTPKQKVLRFSVSGRRFRLIIENTRRYLAGHPPWRIVGGVQINCELDRD